MRLIATAILATSLIGVLVACEDTIDPDPVAPAEQTESSEGVRQPGGTSALGGAKRSADNTAQQLEQRQQDLLKQLEGDQ